MKKYHDRISGKYFQLSRTSKALSHPVRIQILKIISEDNTCICGDLVNTLPLAQSTISQHLSELKKAGLIRGEIDGPRTCYCLDYEAVKSAAGKYEKYFSSLVNQTPAKKKKFWWKNLTKKK